MRLIPGYAYVGEPGQGEVVSLASLKPGDTFRWLPEDDPVMSVLMEGPDYDNPTEQQCVLLRGLVMRAKVYTLEGPHPEGGVTAVEVEA